MLMLFIGITSLCINAQGVKDGDVFRLVNIATGKAITNGDVATHNTNLSTATVDEASKGQSGHSSPFRLKSLCLHYTMTTMARP